MIELIIAIIFYVYGLKDSKKDDINLLISAGGEVSIIYMLNLPYWVFLIFIAINMAYTLKVYANEDKDFIKQRVIYTLKFQALAFGVTVVGNLIAKLL